MKRQLVGGREGNTYWLDADGYVYHMKRDGSWNGWLCSREAWERTFQHSMWKTGDRVLCNGYLGTITRVCTGTIAGMCEVRLASGEVCVSTTELVAVGFVQAMTRMRVANTTAEIAGHLVEFAWDMRGGLGRFTYAVDGKFVFDLREMKARYPEVGEIMTELIRPTK